MTRFFSFFLIVSSVFLSGCFGIGGGGDTTPIESADGFIFSIPEGFVEINSKLVENKQIINKILLSYQKESSEESTGSDFRDNIVVTRAELGPDIDYEQFRSINSKKLFTGLVGYSPKEQKRESFSCNDEKIAGLLVSFDVKNTLGETSGSTFVVQYQFVYKGIGYIVSFAAESEKDRDDATKRITEISCPEPASEE